MATMIIVLQALVLALVLILTSPPSTSPTKKNCLNDSDDSSTTTNDEQFPDRIKFKRFKLDYVDCTPNFFLDSTTKLTIASSSLESASELRSPKFYLDCTSSLEELSGTPSKPRIVPGIEATRRQKNSYGKPDNFNYASRNEVPGPGSNIAVIEAKRHGDQQDDSPTRATIDNASLMDDTTRATDPFNSFQPISRPISKTSFVGYRRRTNYTNEYLIAKVENIVDFLTQYKVKLLKRTQYYMNYSRIFYTLDEKVS